MLSLEAGDSEQEVMLSRCPLHTGHYQCPLTQPRRVTLRRVSATEVGSPAPPGRRLSLEVQASMLSSCLLTPFYAGIGVVVGAPKGRSCAVPDPQAPAQDPDSLGVGGRGTVAASPVTLRTR